MKKVLEIKNVSKQFGEKGNSFTALNNINLGVHEGEFIGIMGPSGAGKTTLLNVVSTIDIPSSGDVFIDGENVVNMKEKTLAHFRRDKLGFIFQDYNLLDSLTIGENIALPLALANTYEKEITKQVQKVATKFGIESILNQYPYQASGGQKQRCAAARAIITKPTLIFGDEPTGALDSKSATDLLESLQTLNEQEKSTIVMVTHDAVAASYCQRIIIIKDGVISTELTKGKATRKAFFNTILETMGKIGGDGHDVV